MTFDQKKYVNDWKKENMLTVSSRYNSIFVLKFRNSLKTLNIKQADVVRDAMNYTNEKADFVNSKSINSDIIFKEKFINLLSIVAEKAQIINSTELQKLYCGIQIDGFMTPLKAVENLEQSFVILKIQISEDIIKEFEKLKEYAKWYDDICIFKENNINFHTSSINSKITLINQKK